MSSDQEIRELAGKLNGPGKPGKWLEISQKRRKIREFSFIFDKEKLRSLFLPFFQGK